MSELYFVPTFLLPPVIVTLTNRLVYVILFFARPLGVFFFSWGSTYDYMCESLFDRSGPPGDGMELWRWASLLTFGVWDLTLPARARDP